MVNRGEYHLLSFLRRHRFAGPKDGWERKARIGEGKADCVRVGQQFFVNHAALLCRPRENGDFQYFMPSSP
jgi:hypothetical protein